MWSLAIHQEFLQVSWPTRGGEGGSGLGKSWLPILWSHSATCMWPVSCLATKTRAASHISAREVSFWAYIIESVKIHVQILNPTGYLPTLQVRDDPKLLDDGGEIPKSQVRCWRFDPSCLISSLLARNLLGGQLPLLLWRWHVGLLS